MLKSYFKTAWRNLRRHRGFTMINLTGLALGLAAFWMIVLYVADELSYDRYQPNADRIYRVVQHARWDGGHMDIALTSPPLAPALRSAFPEVEDAVRIDLEGGGVITHDEKKLKADDIIFADKSLFHLFTCHFLYGDPATALAEPQSIVITQSLAKKLFGSAEKAFEQPIYFDSHFANTVTGIIEDIPVNSHLRFSGARSFPDHYTEGWQNFHIYTYLLLARGAGYRDLEKKLPAFAAHTVQKEMGIKDYRMELQPLTSIHLHSHLGYELSPNGSITRVYLFTGIAVLVLLIAMINYVNLSTARSAARVREVGVRKVIGSGKWQLAGMFIAEAVLLSLLAAVGAAILVRLSLPAFNHLTGKELSVWRFGIPGTLGLLAGFSLVTGVLSGIYPAVFLSRFKTIPALKGQMGSLRANMLFRKSLVVCQFVITVVLITGSYVVYRQLRYVSQADLGFNKDQVLSFHLDNRDIRSELPALKAQLLQSPLIKGAAAAGNPIGNNDLGSQGYEYQKNDGAASDKAKIVQELMVDADFLGTMEIKLAQGRNFSGANPADQANAILVNETLVKELGWDKPIGKQMLKVADDNGKTPPRTVIGVVKDFHTYSLQHKVEPLVMILPPAASDKDNLYVKIAKGKIPEGLAWIQAVYRRFDKTNPIDYHFLDQNFARQYDAEKKQGQVSLIFTGLSILIACLGLFGLVTFMVEQRRREIGIRKVLGASVAGIVQLISGDFIKLVLIAVVIGLPIAWYAMHRWLEDFAYHISLGGWIFLLAGALALAVALLTVGLQAIRAARANPVASLHNE